MNRIVRGMKILYLSDGNRKLKGDENNAFLIWNLLCQKTCPNKTPFCTHDCYGLKAERLYPEVRPCRTLNTIESTKADFVENMTNTINYHLKSKACKGKKIWFRIHESGDFWSVRYLRSFIDIAKAFPHITFLAYTKSVGFVAECIDEIPSNFIIRYSIWEDTKESEIALAKSLNLPIYTAFKPLILDEKASTENYIKCIGDCQKCKMCYTNKVEKIATAIH